MTSGIKSRKRSVHTARSRPSVSRRRGAAARQPRRGSDSVKKLSIIAVAVIGALILAGVAAFGVVGQKIHDVVPGGELVTVIFDAATANAQSIPMTGALGDELHQAADEHRSIRLVGIGGGGKVVSNNVFDMTPKLDNGTVLKVEGRAAQVTDDNLNLLARTINGTTSPAPGQSMFLGLEHLRLNTNAPVYIVSSLLDVSDPVDMRRLGWDVPVKDVVSDLKKSGELPDLTGADITFIVRPVSGEQEQLRQPQVEYREALWTALVEAGGAAKVRFEYADGSAPTSTVAAPLVAIPPPPTTPVPVNPKSRTCTVDTSAYFAPDSDRLLDMPGTRTALQECVAQIGPTSSVKVVGHTAGASPDNKFAVDLSTKRAMAIAKLLESLGVPASHITPVGVGSRNQPYPDPFDARNRSVVVSITN